MILFIIFCSLCFIVVLLMSIGIYLTGIPSGNPVRIKFKDFIQYYTINPKRWLLCDSYVSVCTDITSLRSLFWTEGKCCYFGYFDTFKYKIFKKNLNRKEKEKQINKQYAAILEAVQQDIDSIRKQANQEIKEASDKAIEIAERLKG